MSDKTNGEASLLSYYQDNKFNPVPINVEDRKTWEIHIAKRRNLYERHLGIPFSLLRGKSAIELGCNSGENALVLAMAGANLDLVEPNDQVLPRLKALFERFGVTGQIKNLTNAGVDAFQTKSTYDLVVSEGFLYTLNNRDEMFRKILRLIAPGGLGAMSFVDRYGCLFEFVKKAVLWHACRLAGVGHMSDESLKLAQRAFGDAFSRINSSRSFEVWWKDMLLNPTTIMKYQWSYEELFKILESEGCTFLSSSPQWNKAEYFDWYKNTRTPSEIHAQALASWRCAIPYILTGVRPAREYDQAPDEVIKATYKVVDELSDYASADPIPKTAKPPVYPKVLDAYLASVGDLSVTALNNELRTFFDLLNETNLDRFINGYLALKNVSTTWGTVYHYMSYVKSV